MRLDGFFIVTVSYLRTVFNAKLSAQGHILPIVPGQRLLQMLRGKIRPQRIHHIKIRIYALDR